MQNTLIDNSTGNLSMTSILRRCIAAEGLKEIKNAKGLVTLDDCLTKENWNLECIRERAHKLYQQILQVWPEEWDKEYTEQ